MTRPARVPRYRGSRRKVTRLSFRRHWNQEMTVLCVILGAACLVLWIVLR